MKLLEVKNLTIAFDKTKIIDKLNFSVDEGDFICIVGENGCGKSTLLKAIVGDKPHKAVKYLGIKKNEIGYISQKSKIDEDFPASVEEIVCSGSLNKPSFGVFFSKATKQKAEEILKNLDIAELKKEHFSTLSGGQKQKTLIARALMATDKLLIMDEPSNNLDQKSRKELYELLQKLQEKGIAIIMVTHDLDHGNLIGNKILSLSANLKFFGSTKEYVERIHHA